MSKDPPLDGSLDRAPDPDVARRKETRRQLRAVQQRQLIAEQQAQAAAGERQHPTGDDNEDPADLDVEDEIASELDKAEEEQQRRPSDETPQSAPDGPRLTPDATYAYWATLADLIHPGLASGPDWPALAAALNRATAAGYAAAMLPALAAAEPLPQRHPGRELHYRLLVACPALTSSVTEGTNGSVGGTTSDPVATSLLQHHPEAPPQQPGTPTGPSR